MKTIIDLQNIKAAVKKTTGNSVKVSCKPFKTAGETFHTCG